MESTTKIIHKYLDRIEHSYPVTAKRIAHNARGDTILDLRKVKAVMTKLVESGEWEKTKVWSMDGNMGYRRVKK